jgi:hypothetical protein
VKDKRGHGSISAVDVLSLTAVAEGEALLLCTLAEEKARGQGRKVWERALEEADL